MQDQLTQLEAAAQSAWRPPSTLPEWRWYEEHVVLDATGPMPGRYSTAMTPMVRWVTEVKAQARTRRIVLMISAQSAKTQLLINSILHDIAEDPGPTMWAMAVDDHCEEFAKKRLFTAVEDCEPTSKLLPKQRNRRTRRLIIFDSMSLMLRGSNSRAKLQSDPVRRIYCDERREWRPGAIDLLRKRLRTFHNSIEISAGTAGKVGDELHIDWKEGTQTRFHWNCPHCQHSQPFRFGRKESPIWTKAREKGGLIWDTNPTTKPDGEWNFDAVKQTVRYECQNCGATFRNADKPDLLASLHPVDYNKSAPEGYHSFHWSALYMLWSDCDWAKLVVEFLKAEQALRRGNPEPMKAFITETLGEPWEERGERPKESELKKQCGRHFGEAYDRGQRWTGENIGTVITADVQGARGGYVKWICRQWRPNGNSKLVDYGICLSFEDLRDMQLNRFKPSSVFIDCGFRTQDVYAACLRFGWTPLRGSDHEAFVNQVEGKTERRAWRLSEVDPGIGTAQAGRIALPCIFWSNPTFKDRLLLYVAVGAGPLWMLPDDIGQDYLSELQANERRESRDARGVVRWQWFKTGADDWLDCELMQLVVADAGGLSVEITPEPAEKPAP